MYDKLAHAHEKLRRNQVWCHKCGHTEQFKSSEGFKNGWPLHCGETMSIDSPEEMKAIARA